jgi:acetylornithine/succinyldiaminopimelate/putrescine aminotransferase
MRELGKITREYKFVKAVRGKGLMIGVVLDRPAGALAAAILKHNLITLTAGETVLRLLPALNLTREDADLALERIAAGLKDYAATLED